MKEKIDYLNNIIAEQTRGIYLRDIILVVLVALFLFLLETAVALKKGKTITMGRSVRIIATLAYAGVLCLITLLRRQAGSRAGQIHTYIYFGELSGGWFSSKQGVYSLLNVALFIPWGFLLRLHRKDDGFIKGVFMTGLAGFLTSFVIEVIQFDTGRGIFEMTDIVTNITGTVIGAVLASLAIVIYRNIKQEKENE